MQDLDDVLHAFDFLDVASAEVFVPTVQELGANSVLEIARLAEMLLNVFDYDQRLVHEVLHLEVELVGDEWELLNVLENVLLDSL